MAALRLGNVLDTVDGDPAAARPWFVLARDRGSGRRGSSTHAMNERRVDADVQLLGGVQREPDAAAPAQRVGLGDLFESE